MVQIEPPPDWSPDDEAEVAAAGVASAAVTGKPIAPASPPLAVSRAAPASGDTANVAEAASKSAIAKSAPASQSPAKPNAATVVGADSTAPVSAAAVSAAAVSPAAATVAANQPIIAASVRRVPISPVDASQSAAEASRWFWPTFSGVTLLALAAAGLVIYWNRHDAASASTPASMQLSAVPPSVEMSAAPQSKTPEPVKPVRTVAAAVATPSAPAVAVSPAVPPKAVGPTVAPPVAPAPVRAAPPAKRPAAPSVAQAAPNVPQPVAPQPTVPQAVAPLVDPAAGVAESDPATGPMPDPTPAAAPPAAALPVAAPPVAVLPAAAAAAPAALPPMARPSLQRIAPRDVDLDARLADRVQAIEFQEAPLSQFLSDLAQMSTVPISLDGDALAEMNLSADMPISVQLKNTTLAGILDEALTARGLGWRAAGHQIEVGRAPSQQLRRVRYSVSDLTGNSPESRLQFAELVHALIEPSGWSEADGSATSVWSDGALMVTADASAHAQMLVFCEKLRLARGLPLRSRVPAERFHLDSRTAHAKAGLNVPITANFARPESLEKILGYLQSTTHLNLLIDHAALAADGISAESEGALVAQQQPLSQALAALLEPMELTYRVIDDRTIEITTPKAAAARAEVEFYPAGDLLAAGSEAHELVARITRELAAADQAGPRNPAAPRPSIQFDAPSKYLIVRAPQNVQHRIEALLGSWRIAKQ
jgi:hypothetical protein